MFGLTHSFYSSVSPFLVYHRLIICFYSKKRTASVFGMNGGKKQKTDPTSNFTTVSRVVGPSIFGFLKFEDLKRLRLSSKEMLKEVGDFPLVQHQKESLGYRRPILEKGLYWDFIVPPLIQAGMEISGKETIKSMYAKRNIHLCWKQQCRKSLLYIFFYDGALTLNSFQYCEICMTCSNKFMKEKNTKK